MIAEPTNDSIEEIRNINNDSLEKTNDLTLMKGNEVLDFQAPIKTKSRDIKTQARVLKLDGEPAKKFNDFTKYYRG